MGSFFHPMWPHTLELSVVPPQIAPAALTYLPVSTPLDSMQCIRLSRTTSILWHRIGMEGSRLVTFPAANIRLFRNFFLFSAHPCSTGLHIFSFTLSFVAFSQGLRLPFYYSTSSLYSFPIYIYYPTYLIHFLESPAISQVTRYLTDTKFILVVQSHNVVLS